MTPAPTEVLVADPPWLSDEALAAASPGLLAQPALWSSLRLVRDERTLPESGPWTVYWATRLNAALDPLAARTRLAAACDAMTQRGDRIGELACLAAIIEGYYVDEGPLESLDGRIAALVDRLPADDAWPSPDVEAHVMACGIGILLRAPRHPLLARWAERGAVLVRQIKPGAGRLKLATFLAQYHFWRGEFDRTALIVDALPGLDVAGLLPAEALVWLETVANHARCAGEPARGRAAIDSALQLLRLHGLQHHVYALHAHGASLALADGDADGAQVHVDAMRPVLDSRPQADQTHYWHFQAGLALARGDALRAVELARAAMGNAGEIGGPYRSAMQALSLGQALLCAGDAASALASIEQAIAAARSIDAGLVLCSATLMQAACLFRLERRAAALQALRDGWTQGARRNYATTASWWLPDVMGELAREALAHDIEPAYVRRFVRRHALPGPDPVQADWPWPLVLRAFGSFEALYDDEPLVRSSGKTAQRPLDLLRVLLAHGGRLPVATALQWLWPDADSAAQRKAFDVALLRLRRMLDDPRLLHLEGGRLAFDVRWVWSDVGALQLLMQAIGQSTGTARGTSLQQLQRWARQLLDLMRGPFLSGDEADWVRAARERHRRRFVVAVDQLAVQIEPLDAPAALRLYERALDVEPLAESLSRRLMRLHAQAGDRAEALRVWRACRAMLQVAEGLEPSRETRALAAALGLGDAR